MAATHQGRAAAWRAWGLALLLVTGAATASASSLFDGRAGTPLAQGWLPLQQGAAAQTGVETGGFRLNTLADADTQQGYFRFSPLALDADAGYALSFDLQVDGATSSSSNRGGFSLLLVGADPAQSLELVFDTGVVFAYDYVAGDADRFVRGASAPLSGGAPHSFLLQVLDGGYTLSIDGDLQLAGRLADYHAQGLPYTMPNFIFFGDNTTRAASNVLVGAMSISPLSPVPEPATLLLALAGGAGLLLRWRLQVV